MKSQLKSLLDNAHVEKDVENAYRAEVSRLKDATWSSPFGTDGLASWPLSPPSTVRLLLEAKYNKDLKAKSPVCDVLGQMILYLKKFEVSGSPLPNVLLVGDKDECFVLATSAVQGFLSLDIDWTVAPSAGNPELTRALVQGFNLLPYVFDVDDNLDFKEVLTKVENLASGVLTQVRANLHNLSTIFTYWRDRVFQGKDTTATEQVDVFLRCLFQPSNVYLHPTKHGVLVVPGYPEGILVSAGQYKSFFDHFQQGYKPSEVEAFYAMKDRLVEDEDRRRQGAFFTPSLWVSEAHAELERVLGPNWRAECLVWDPAAGTANLTRDYNDWGCLISSTAERPDVAVMTDQGWGGEHVFQYDFLNPGVQSPFFEENERNVLPASVDAVLREAAKAGKRLVWLMNPPYAEHSTAGTAGKAKTGVAKTTVNVSMGSAKMGLASRQLYAQFMFQCSKVAEEYGFQDSTVATFSVPTFMSSGSYKKFRGWWYGQHAYEGGFLFQASHFADVSGVWGISFTIWNSEGQTDPKADLPMRLTDAESFAVATTGNKSVYNSDGREASKWVREPVKGLVGVDAPQMTSGLKVVGSRGKTLILGALYNYNCHSNNLQKSRTDNYLTTSCSTGNAGVSVLPTNWRRAVALYGARKLVLETWDTQKDEYLVPEETHPGYKQWVNDNHVFTVMDSVYNNCTAMRNVQYKGTLWRIKNHWFWRSREQTLEDLDTAETGSLYRDCKAEPTKTSEINLITGEEETNPWELTGDAYFAHLLSTGQVTLSPDAQIVLDLLDALWVKSLPVRESYAAGKPELHLETWDAGCYQLKHLFRDLFPTEWLELKEAHKALATRLQDGVYDFGFLKR